MKKKSKLLKSFIGVICIISIFFQSVLIEAENTPIPSEIEPDIKYLTGHMPIMIQGIINGSINFLALNGLERPSSLKDPFGREMFLPVVIVLEPEKPDNISPSDYILENLPTEFEYVVWDLDEYESIQLANYEGYELYIDGVKGQPIMARWAIRQTGKGATEYWPLEHVLDYMNAAGEWVNAMTRYLKWGEPTDVIEGGKVVNQEQALSEGLTINNPNIYWKEIQELDENNISPIVNGQTPEPAMSKNKDNIGTISGTLITKEEELYSDYNFSSKIEVVGAVTQNILEQSNEMPIPKNHFKMEHDISRISHLIEGERYIKLGSGTVSSEVTDYENDVTIFTQEIIVSTKGRPDIDIYFAGTDIPYDMEWMSVDESADTRRRDGLDIQANSTFNGNYDLVTRISGTEASRSNVTKDVIDETVTNDKISEWTTWETSKDGIPATSIIYLKDSSSITLSVESDAKYMRFDSTVPTISTVSFADDNWETVVSHDANDDLSGLETLNESKTMYDGVYYQFVKLEESKNIETPKNGTDWMKLADYELPKEANEYDLYVYAKDNATNRSEAVRLNKEPIVIPDKSQAKIRLEKKVVDDKGNNQEIFLLHMKENDVILGSVALKKNEMSGWMTLHMKGESSRTIEILEVVPMDYGKDYLIYVTDANREMVLLEGNEVILKAGDEITITIENEFNHAGFFRDKDAVKNAFRSMN